MILKTYVGADCRKIRSVLVLKNGEEKPLADAVETFGIAFVGAFQAFQITMSRLGETLVKFADAVDRASIFQVTKS